MFWKCLFIVTDTDVQCFGQFGFMGFLSLIQVFFLSKITDPIGRDILLKHKKNLKKHREARMRNASLTQPFKKNLLNLLKSEGLMLN